MSDRSGAELRQQLRHPVIDIDGHTVESMPALPTGARPSTALRSGRDTETVTVPGPASRVNS